MKLFKSLDSRGVVTDVDCARDPSGSLLEMFVRQVQAGRIARGQCPALRPVFLKPHGVVRGIFRICKDLPKDLQVGVFAGHEFPAWVRFSSDTVPTASDYKTTVGVGIKLFGVPGQKSFGSPSDTTCDFILQNAEVFFVDTAADMCAFTKAGVVDGDYRPYLAAHPETARLLDDMAKPVSSLVASTYWSCVPFRFGAGRFVKYKLEATTTAPPLEGSPPNPTYLAADLESRLKSGDVRYRFSVQFQTEPATMPLDRATVPWNETVSVPVHIADLILPQQEVSERGQATYGENLSWNIWRVTDEHAPVGSIAEVRRAVYAASAEQRRNVNGVPNGEPEGPRPLINTNPCVDSVVVRAAIHPGIGVARIGDSKTDFFIGPEIIDSLPAAVGFYRDSWGALKRQAARFRIFGMNAEGKIVRELTAGDALIRWTVHLANKKAQWYQFQAALDIPDAVKMKVPRRNKNVAITDRHELAIDPGPRSISGISMVGGKEHLFDTGTFKETIVPLGEIRTDEGGRLLVLGGEGNSGSPSNAPVFVEADANSFNNADDWYDDISDGPVTAEVSINGQAIPVDPAWVVVAPPNYAPGIVGWRTLYDLLVDIYIQCGWMEMPPEVSFTNHILPMLKRLSNLQWVNRGFAAMFGKGGPLDFNDSAFVSKLARTPDRVTQSDLFGELRRLIFHNFRPADTSSDAARLWPWIYGDAYGSFSATSPRNSFALSTLQEVLLRRWANGDFVSDWDPTASKPTALDQLPIEDQPAALDRAALQSCLADAFHPGCEMTWPMRHTTMYQSPFRIRHRAAGQAEADNGDALSQDIVIQPGGPLYAQGPGDISRWMALPWQGDTAFCRSGYEAEFDPYLPTFWAARVPNQVLTEEDYATVMNASLPREQRIAAFNTRLHWLRALGGISSAPEVMLAMVSHFGAMGLMEARPGIVGDSDFPEIMYVESLAGSRLRETAVRAARVAAAPPRPLTAAELAGWDSQAQLEAFRAIRVRHSP